MNKGLIEIQVDNVSEQETFRLQEIIHRLLAEGALNVRNGCVTLRYDNDATLQQIEIDYIKWRRQKK